MLPVFLIAMLFATSNGTLMCFVSKYASCYGVIKGAALQQCRADEAIQCLKNTADECDINNSTDAGAMEKVLGMEQMLADLCKTGSDMNAAFLKHRSCVFGKELTQFEIQCYLEPILEAVRNYKKTGNAEKDMEALVKIACEFRTDITECVSAKVEEICGEDARSFQRKLSEPANKLEDMACNSSPAPFGPFWIVLLQASVILRSLYYFRIKE